jgi:hypothetical protein
MTGKNWLLFFARNTHFVDFMTVLHTTKTSPFGYSFGDVVFFERMLADRAATLRNTVLFCSFRFLSN